MTDYWSHKFHEDPKLLEEIEDDDFDPEAVDQLIKDMKKDEWEEVK